MHAMVGGIYREKKKKGKERGGERAREKEKELTLFLVLCALFFFSIAGFYLLQ